MIEDDQIVRLRNNKNKDVIPEWMDVESLKYINKDTELIKKYKRI